MGRILGRRKTGALRRLSELKREFQKIPMGDPMDKNYKRIQYVRYADDFIVTAATKEIAEEAKELIRDFLKTESGTV